MKINLYSKGAQRFIDASVCAMAWFAAYYIRFEGQIPAVAYRQMLFLVLPYAAGQIGISNLLGIYRFQWRYISVDDALSIARAYLIVPVILLTVRTLFGSSLPALAIPASVIAIAFVLSFCGVASARLARRFLYQRSPRHGFNDIGVNGAKRRFLLVGAGAHGAMVAREMLIRKGIEVVGFVDDDPSKRGAIIAGIPVLGRAADIPQIVSSRKVDEILVCISPKSRQGLRINDLSGNNGSCVPSRIVPTLEEVLQTANAVSVLPALMQPNGTAVNEPPGTDDDVHSAGSAQSPLAVRGNGETVVNRAHFSSDVHSGSSVSSSPPLIQNKTILITGGAGFIGSSVAEKLVDHNRLIILDQTFGEGPIRFTSLLKHPNVTKVQGSILDIDLRSLLKDADVVIHAAAILGVNRVCNSGRETLETNYVGTSRLLKALDASPGIERFVYFSTSEVFGVNSYRVDETSRPIIGPIAESRWSYAMSKLAGEHLVASYFRETHLPIAIVRPFNIFGPRRTGDYALRRFILNALMNEPLEVHGDGTQIRSWCYIEDFCSALLKMISRTEAIGEDFNIGHPGNTVTVYELAQKVIELTSSSSPIVFRECAFPDISIRVPSLDKARRLLGFVPKYDLNTGLKQTIQWHRENLALIQPHPHAPMVAGYVANPSAA